MYYMNDINKDCIYVIVMNILFYRNFNLHLSALYVSPALRDDICPPSTDTRSSQQR